MAKCPSSLSLTTYPKVQTNRSAEGENAQCVMKSSTDAVDVIGLFIPR
jgi:hypothetical protein